MVELSAIVDDEVRAFEPPGVPPFAVVLHRRRRQRRRHRVEVAGAVVAAVVGVAVIPYALSAVTDAALRPVTTTTTTTTATTATATATTVHGWERLPPAPLTPRSGPQMVVVGDEVLVLGGDAQRLCPPGALCAARPDPQRDGAAYDVTRRSWTSLAPAPVPPGEGSVVAVGSTVYLVTHDGFWDYERGTDTWSPLPPAPVADGRLVAAGEDLLLVRGSQEDGRSTPDHAFDLSTRTWRALPPDPLRPAYARCAVWDGEQVVLVATPLTPRTDDPDAPPVFPHAARLDLLDNTWTTVPQQDEVIGQGQCVWAAGRVVAPSVAERSGGSEPTGGYLDTRTGDWSRLPSPPAAGTARVTALSDAWMTAGEGLVLDVQGNRWLPLDAPAGQAPQALTGAWAGDRLVVFGGGDSADGSLSGAAWSWRAER